MVQGIHALVQGFQLVRVGAFLPVAGAEHPAGFQHRLPPVAPHGLEDFPGHQFQLPFGEGFQFTDALGQAVFLQIQGGLLFVAVALKAIDLGAVRLGVPQIPPQLGTAVAHQLGDPYVLGDGAAVLAGLAVFVQQIPLAASADVVAPVPEFLVDDGGEVSLFQDVSFLVVVLLPGVVQQVGGPGAVVDAVAHVGGVAQDAGDLAGIPFHVPAAILAAFCDQGLGYLAQPVAGGVLFKDHPHRLGLFLVDDVGVVGLVQIVAQDVAVAEKHPFLPAHLDAGPHPLAGLAAFLLGHGGHDGEPQLSFVVHRPDAVRGKVDLHSQLAQLPGVEQRVHRVAGEAADLAGDYQVKLATLCIFNHLHERRTFGGLGAGDALVHILAHHLPVGVLGCQFLIPVHLIVQRRYLGLMFGGNPPVKHHAAGTVPVFL